LSGNKKSILDFFAAATPRRLISLGARPMGSCPPAGHARLALIRWALSVPMFIKILGIGVLVVLVFAALTAWYLHDQARLELFQMAVGAGVCLLISAGMAALLARLVTRPINRLVAAVNRIGEGDFHVRAEVDYHDEIGQLAQAFNRMAEHLEQYRAQVEDKERARQRLIERIVDAQEEERRHIARELHDQVGQSLMALLLAVQSGCQHRDAPDRYCPQVESKIRELSEEIHRLAWGMRPSILDDYGLESALERYLDQVGQQSKLNIDYQPTSPPDSSRLPDRLEVTLYRIVQEAITNVIRHAKAKNVSVVILRQRDAVTLLIEDDGRGFAPAGNDVAGSRLGLTGMQERAALYGGECIVESEPGRGTTIRVKIPLSEEQACLSSS
jgi:signal transduction histidine kinase